MQKLLVYMRTGPISVQGSNLLVHKHLFSKTLQLRYASRHTVRTPDPGRLCEVTKLLTEGTKQWQHQVNLRSTRVLDLGALISPDKSITQAPKIRSFRISKAYQTRIHIA